MRHLRYRLDAHADRGDANDLLYAPPAGVVLPDVATNIAWRAPIRDQLEEGSCTGHAGRNAMCALRAKLGLHFTDLSPQALYNRILFLEYGTAANDNGASIRSITKALAKYGICREEIWPYLKTKFSTPLTPVAVADAARFRPTQYRRVQDVYGLRYAIAIDKLPVVIGVSWYQSGMSDAAARTGAIPVPTKGDKNVGGHALECDGYDFENSSHPAPVFDSPNSWGADWGDHGGYHMPLAIVQSSDCLNDVWVLTDAAKAA